MTQKNRSDKDELPLRRGRAESVAPDISRVAMAAFTRAGFSDPTLVLRWAEIVGPEVARLARPFRFSEGPSGGVLTLKAEPGAALFLGHETRALCDHINAYLGRAAVTRLKFIQGSLSPRPSRPLLRPKQISLSPGDPARRYCGPDMLAQALLRLAKSRSV